MNVVKPVDAANQFENQPENTNFENLERQYEFEQQEKQNVVLVNELFESLNTQDAVEVSQYFSDFASLQSVNDSISPVDGKKAIREYFQDLFARASDLKIELVCSPVAFGNLVLVKQRDEFTMDDVKHKIYFVGTVYIVNGKIQKWIACQQHA